MLTQIIYLAVAIYYKQKNPVLGLQMLLEQKCTHQLPQDFLDWWHLKEGELTDQCARYSDMGIRFTYPGCWDYPEIFLDRLEFPPLFISYLGEPGWNNNSHLAVVGSRKMSPLTKEWLEIELKGFLGQHPVTVISGGARGVDQTAHLCALRAKCPTYIFLPSGLNKLYPRDLLEWRDDVIKGGGAFISEYWPDEEIKKHYFVERNRLIAAMSTYLLIAQGELRSGTMLTAQWGLEMGLRLGVVPGHARDPMFSANHSLLRMGISAIVDQNDLSTNFYWGDFHRLFTKEEED